MTKEKKSENIISSTNFRPLSLSLSANMSGVKRDIISLRRLFYFPFRIFYSSTNGCLFQHSNNMEGRNGRQKMKCKNKKECYNNNKRENPLTRYRRKGRELIRPENSQISSWITAPREKHPRADARMEKIYNSDGMGPGRLQAQRMTSCAAHTDSRNPASTE